MSFKQFGIHSCWLDKEDRELGVPPFLYLHLYWFTVRLNPPYQKDLAHFDSVALGRKVSPWNLKPWHWVQAWRNTTPLPPRNWGLRWNETTKKWERGRDVEYQEEDGSRWAWVRVPAAVQVTEEPAQPAEGGGRDYDRPDSGSAGGTPRGRPGPRE